MADVVFADLVDADPAPRALTPIMRRYIAGQATYLWGGLAFCFLVLPNAALAAAMHRSEMLAGTSLVFVISAVLILRATLIRRQLRAILVHGEQRPAHVVDMHRLHVRGGHRDTLWLDVDGRRVKCSSWAGDLENAEPRAWIRVLVHPAYPARAVPVVSVT